MIIVLSVLCVAFAAFCIWLTVRIVNRREMWSKRTALGLLIGVPLLDVGSFGPACWIAATPRIAGASDKPRSLDAILFPDRGAHSSHSFA